MTLILAVALFVQDPCGSCGNKPRTEARYCDQCGRRLGPGADLGPARKAAGSDDYKKALALLTPILDDDPRNYDALLLRAEAGIRLAKYDLAKDDARRASKINEAAPPLVLLATATRLSAGEREREALLDAEALLVRALKLAPDSPSALRECARLHLRLGETREALDAAERALKLDPKSSDSHAVRAEIRAKQRDFAGALADYDRALELDPKHAPTIQARGVMRCEIGMDGLEVAEPRWTLRKDLSAEERTLLIQDLEAALQSLRGGLREIEESGLEGSYSKFVMAIRVIIDHLKELHE